MWRERVVTNHNKGGAVLPVSVAENNAPNRRFPHDSENWRDLGLVEIVETSVRSLCFFISFCFFLKQHYLSSS